MEKIATDIYTFSELRKNGFTYVDKTDALYDMASGEVGNMTIVICGHLCQLRFVNNRNWMPVFEKSIVEDIVEEFETLERENA